MFIKLKIFLNFPWKCVFIFYGVHKNGVHMNMYINLQVYPTYSHNNLKTLLNKSNKPSGEDFGAVDSDNRPKSGFGYPNC